MADCPCTSGKDFDECCGPLIRGERPADTAEELMRSRYAAYAAVEIDYLRDTTYPSRRREVDSRATRAWAENSTWTGLEVISIEEGGPDDERGIVEFIARYSRDGDDVEHHEVAEFRRKEGVWYFVDGKRGGAETFVRQEPKVGRNDPCPCGSGRKYKKCCGRA